MSKSFKDFFDNVRAMDAKKALQSLKESDDKYLEKRSKKYFNEEVKDEAEDKASEVKKVVSEAKDEVADKAAELKDEAEDKAAEVKDAAEDKAVKAKEAVEDKVATIVLS